VPLTKIVDAVENALVIGGIGIWNLMWHTEIKWGLGFFLIAAFQKEIVLGSIVPISRKEHLHFSKAGQNSQEKGQPKV